MKVWILTMEVDDYDKHGEFFVQVFRSFPTDKELADADIPKPTIISPTSVGYWVSCSYIKDRWWYLREHVLVESEVSNEDFPDTLTTEEFYSIEDDGNRLSLHNRHLKDII